MDMRDEKIWFEAVLFPQRSLGKTGFRILMGTIVLLSAAIGIAFYRMGAWPVSGFFGLDVLLIYVAFRIQYEHGKSMEIIRLAGETLTITRIDHKGRRKDVSFNSYWVSVNMSCPPNVPANVGEKLIEARSHGKGTFFGMFLTQEKRAELLMSLKQALVESKSYHPA